MEGKGRIVKVLVLLFLITPPLNASYLKEIQKRYSNLPGLILSYKRKIISRTLNMVGSGMKEDVATGKIFLKPPYFIRIEQEKPEHELVINDGSYIWWYIPLKKLAYKYRAEAFSKELQIVKDIFCGMNKIEKQFRVSMKKKENIIYVLLFPVGQWQDIEKIEIQADVNDFKIKKIKIYNLFGSITCFVIKNETITNIRDEIFSVHIPSDTRIIEKQ